MTLWTVAHQASLTMGFSRQEYWSGLPLPSSGDLPDPGIEPRSPTLRADAFPSEPPGEPCCYTAETNQPCEAIIIHLKKHTHTHKKNQEKKEACL